MKAIIFFLFAIVAISFAVNPYEHRPIPLSSVQTLTFQKGVYTTGRRVSPIPQLNCI